jgi:hypothetical protein
MKRLLKQSKSRQLFRIASTPNLRHVQQGQAIVEFAMIMPILVLLLLGIVFFAMAFNLQMVLNAAAREGARAWASNRAGTSPCLADQTALGDHSCEPIYNTSGTSDFQKNIVPLVRKYLTDNGYDGEKVIFGNVRVTKKEFSPQDWNTLPDELIYHSIEDATKVRLVISYPYTLPTTGAGFELVTLRAEYTFKRGS